MRAMPISRLRLVYTGVWLAVLLPALALGAPGLRPPVYYGPLAGLFYEAPEHAPLSAAGQALLLAAPPAGLMGIYAPFRQKLEETKSN